MRKILFIFVLMPFISVSQNYADLLPEVAWRTIVDSVVYQNVDTFTVKVNPVDLNDIGAFDKTVGNFLFDNKQRGYKIIDNSALTDGILITVVDVFKSGAAPFQGLLGFVVETPNGAFPSGLGTFYGERLDPTNSDYRNAIDLRIAYEKGQTIPFDSTRLYTGYTPTGTEPEGTSYWDSSDSTVKTVLKNREIYEWGKLQGLINVANKEADSTGQTIFWDGDSSYFDVGFLGINSIDHLRDTLELHLGSINANTQSIKDTASQIRADISTNQQAIIDSSASLQGQIDVNATNIQENSDSITAVSTRSLQNESDIDLLQSSSHPAATLTTDDATVLSLNESTQAFDFNSSNLYSGITNSYVPYLNGSALDNSPIQTNSSRVWIGGTDNGTDALQVAGNVEISAEYPETAGVLKLYGNAYIAKSAGVYNEISFDYFNSDRGMKIQSYGTDNGFVRGLRIGDVFTGSFRSSLIVRNGIYGGRVLIGLEEGDDNGTDALQVAGSTYAAGKATALSSLGNGSGYLTTIGDLENASIDADFYSLAIDGTDINDIISDSSHPQATLTTDDATVLSLNESTQSFDFNSSLLDLDYVTDNGNTTTNPLSLHSVTPNFNIGGAAVNQTNSGTIRLLESSDNYQGAYITYNGATNMFYIGTHASTSTNTADDIPFINVNRGSTDVYFPGDVYMKNSGVRSSFVMSGNYGDGITDINSMKFLYDVKTGSVNDKSIASIKVFNTQNTVNSGGEIWFETKPDGVAGGVPSRRMVFHNDGSLSINTTSNNYTDNLLVNGTASGSDAYQDGQFVTYGQDAYFNSMEADEILLGGTDINDIISDSVANFYTKTESDNRYLQNYTETDPISLDSINNSLRPDIDLNTSHRENDLDISPLNELQLLSSDNTPGNISITDGNTITLNVNDGDFNSSNELQSLTISNDTISLSDGGFVVVPSGTGLWTTDANGLNSDGNSVGINMLSSSTAELAVTSSKTYVAEFNQTETNKGGINIDLAQSSFYPSLLLSQNGDFRWNFSNSGYLDIKEIGNPGNPPTGYGRFFPYNGKLYYTFGGVSYDLTAAAGSGTTQWDDDLDGISYSDGNVAIGTSAQGATQLFVNTSNDDWAAVLRNTTSSNANGVLVQGGASSSDAAFAVNDYSGTRIFEVTGAGEILATQLSSGTKSKIVYWDSTDGQFYQGDAPTGSIYTGGGFIDVTGSVISLDMTDGSLLSSLDATDQFLVNDGTEKRTTLSTLTNYFQNNLDFDYGVSSIVAGDLIDINNSTGDVTIDVDLTELSIDYTATTNDWLPWVDDDNGQKIMRISTLASLLNAESGNWSSDTYGINYQGGNVAIGGTSLSTVPFAVRNVQSGFPVLIDNNSTNGGGIAIDGNDTDNSTFLIDARNSGTPRFQVSTGGDVYMPDLPTGTLDDVVYVDDVTGRLYIGTAPTGGGGGDMYKAVYDPTNVNGDAFDMDNMVEGTNKILTTTERNNIANNTTFYTTPSTRITAGTDLSWSGNTLNYTGSGSGLTSVGLSMPTGFSVSNSPLTANGTLNVSFASGYSLPTTASQTNWNDAYNNYITDISVSGTNTKTITLTQRDGGNITESFTDLQGSGVYKSEVGVSPGDGTQWTSFGVALSLSNRYAIVNADIIVMDNNYNYLASAKWVLFGSYNNGSPTIAYNELAKNEHANVTFENPTLISNYINIGYTSTNGTDINAFVTYTYEED